MEGVPEVDAGELLNATSNGTLGEAPASFLTMNTTQNKTSSVQAPSNIPSLKVVEAPKVNVSEKVQVNSQ